MLKCFLKWFSHKFIEIVALLTFYYAQHVTTTDILDDMNTRRKFQGYFNVIKGFEGYCLAQNASIMPLYWLNTPLIIEMVQLDKVFYSMNYSLEKWNLYLNSAFLLAQFGK